MQKAHLTSGRVDANISLRWVLRYFIKHYYSLRFFCIFNDVKMDNNLIGAMLKRMLRDRKNAMLHNMLHEATIWDIITSMIASEAGINVFEYLTTLQREKVQVKAHSQYYLPWNYLDQTSSLPN